MITLYCWYLLAAAVALALWFSFSKKQMIGVLPLAIVLSTTWGLFQLSVFMGYGLVGVPQFFKLMSSLEKRFEMELC